MSESEPNYVDQTEQQVLLAMTDYLNTHAELYNNLKPDCAFTDLNGEHLGTIRWNHSAAAYVFYPES